MPQYKGKHCTTEMQQLFWNNSVGNNLDLMLKTTFLRISFQSSICRDERQRIGCSSSNTTVVTSRSSVSLDCVHHPLSPDTPWDIEDKLTQLMPCYCHESPGDSHLLAVKAQLSSLRIPDFFDSLTNIFKSQKVK